MMYLQIIRLVHLCFKVRSLFFMNLASIPCDDGSHLNTFISYRKVAKKAQQFQYMHQFKKKMTKQSYAKEENI